MSVSRAPLPSPEVYTHRLYVSQWHALGQGSLLHCCVFIMSKQQYSSCVIIQTMHSVQTFSQLRHVFTSLSSKCMWYTHGPLLVLHSVNKLIPPCSHHKRVQMDMMHLLSCSVKTLSHYYYRWLNSIAGKLSTPPPTSNKNSMMCAASAHRGSVSPAAVI